LNTQPKKNAVVGCCFSHNSYEIHSSFNHEYDRIHSHDFREEVEEAISFHATGDAQTHTATMTNDDLPINR